jgi:hypothetical protein
VRECFNEGDLDVGGEVGVVGTNVLDQEIVELGTAFFPPDCKKKKKKKKKAERKVASVIRRMREKKANRKKN